MEVDETLKEKKKKPKLISECKLTHLCLEIMAKLLYEAEHVQ